MRFDQFLREVLAEGEHVVIFHDSKTYSLFGEDCPPKAAFNFLKTRFLERAGKGEGE